MNDKPSTAKRGQTGPDAPFRGFAFKDMHDAFRQRLAIGGGGRIGRGYHGRESKRERNLPTDFNN